MHSCPAPHQLEELLDELLNDLQRSGVEAHVEACPVCQQVLERLAAAEDGGRSSRPPQGPDPLDATFLRHLKRLFPGDTRETGPEEGRYPSRETVAELARTR